MDRRSRPRGNDIITQIEDLTHKVLRKPLRLYTLKLIPKVTNHFDDGSSFQVEVWAPTRITARRKVLRYFNGAIVSIRCLGKA